MVLGSIRQPFLLHSTNLSLSQEWHQYLKSTASSGHVTTQVQPIYRNASPERYRQLIRSGRSTSGEGRQLSYSHFHTCTDEMRSAYVMIKHIPPVEYTPDDLSDNNSSEWVTSYQMTGMNIEWDLLYLDCMKVLPKELHRIRRWFTYRQLGATGEASSSQ